MPQARLAPALLAVLLLVAAGGVAADPREIGDDERVIGSDDAPVTIIEYASLTCPACARFHTDVLPEVKERYVDTGEARIVYRDFPLDRLAFAAAIIARCLEPAERSLAALELLYARQDEWTRSDSPIEAIVDLLEPLDVDDDVAGACLADEELANDILEVAKQGYQAFSIEGTPTFVVDGEPVLGLFTLGEFEQVMDRRLAR